ncbi:alpha/beta fold hydrolase [Fodinicola feengrottensis]|uniref:AB hydrolase-1 domain-containing protein n=1 Tax=Fodinicola feengrottensis TaxID=435914 RepID=A0ABP4UV71_9ACTN|nr:alpha/beta hydrolase [Fodinicola feengrottensis]
MSETFVLVPEFREIDGLRIRYAESGRGASRTFLLTNPWPESLYAFHPIWNQLAQDAHVVAIDLPGFGQSERRAELYSPQAMGRFLISVVDSFGLVKPHLVGPDVGTSASLFAELARPGTFATITIGSGGASVPLNVTGILKDIIEAPDLDGLRAQDSRAILSPALDAIEPRLPAEIREDYLLSYEGDGFVESSAFVRRYAAELPILASKLSEISTPVQIISGRKDPVVPPENGEFLAARLPNAVARLVDSGHFVWEEASQEYGKLVTSWADEHPAE